MKQYIGIFLLFSSFNLIAGITPENINYKGSKAVYIDFISANYEITYDIANEVAKGESTIVFNQQEDGYPIFDLVPEAEEAYLDGEKVLLDSLKAPEDVTTYKTLSKEFPAGRHTLIIKNIISDAVEFSKGGVQSAFWMSDLTDRRYLEQYLPTNLEYDKYEAQFNIHFLGATSEQNIYTNGVVEKISANNYKIIFPKYFTASSFYFHTATKGKFSEDRFEYTLKSGKKIPVVIYSNWSWNVSRAKSQTLEIMKELEQNFGDWPHPSITIYVAGRGGMEYCGATITALSALEHELTHSYYARGVMPLNGNSGWIDEAVATWRGQGYPENEAPNFSSSSMASHSMYRRTTDRDAYSKGANFMGYLNHQLRTQGGLTKFLSQFFAKYYFKSVTTELFRAELEQFSGQNYEQDFKTYIYGVKGEKSIESNVENPFHPQLTKTEILELL